MLAWHQSGTVLMMLILGGMGTLFGAVLGTFSYVLLQEWFSGLTKHWQLLMGLFIVAAVLLFPQGLSACPAATHALACGARFESDRMAEPLLAATALTRRFGGLVAVDQVDAGVARGRRARGDRPERRRQVDAGQPAVGRARAVGRDDPVCGE